jgi:hypothetical protein
VAFDFPPPLSGGLHDNGKLMLRSRIQGVLAFLGWSIVFGVSYTQAPLYYSNQNQYFLHGLAEAGRGDLDHDWLANTKDPTPVFSAIVAFTAQRLHEWCFYLYYLLMLGLYFHSLVGVFTWLAPAGVSSPARLIFISLFVMMHAGMVRLASAQLFGVDYPWFLQAGVAGQYLLGFGLQPSVFGVFLFTSIAAFLRERPWRAVIWACLAAVLHATYMLSAALLTVSYMLLTYRERGLWRAVFVGVLALILVLPSVIYNLVTFAPTSPGEFAEAQHILAHIRIPHHAVVARWFDGIALGQILGIVLAIVLVRRTKLFVIMLMPFFGSVILTLVQLWTGNDTLALLFPWRTSALLMPLATTIILTKIVFTLRSVDFSPRFAKAAIILATSALGISFVVGVAIQHFALAYHTHDAELPLLEFVRKNHRPGDIYLVPVELPKPWTGAPGVFSSNFMPAPRKGNAGGFIAIDLQRFRLATGTPLYVDFKSIPYKDDEVLEWYRRVLWCTDLYARQTPLGLDLRAALTSNGVTHVVAPATNAVRFAGLGPPVYRDEAYRIFSVAKK